MNHQEKLRELLDDNKYYVSGISQKNEIWDDTEVLTFEIHVYRFKHEETEDYAVQHAKGYACIAACRAI